MNPKQKTYDSYDYTIRMQKVSQSLSHNKNLDLIKKRKAPSLSNSISSNSFRRRPDPVNQYFKNKNDTFMNNKLLEIIKKPVKPKLNEDFIHNEQKKREYHIKMKAAEKRRIDQVNEEMFKRMTNLRSFISVKTMDDQYLGDHKKLVKKLKRVEEGKLLLPNITMRNMGHHHQRNMTDANIDRERAKEHETCETVN